MENKASGATQASVSASTDPVTIFAAATSKIAARFVYNDPAGTAGANLYLKLGSGASSTSFFVIIPASGFYEFPKSPLWSGLVTGAWASAAGVARTTEY